MTAGRHAPGVQPAARVRASAVEWGTVRSGQIRSHHKSVQSRAGRAALFTASTGDTCIVCSTLFQASMQQGAGAHSDQQTACALCLSLQPTQRWEHWQRFIVGALSCPRGAWPGRAAAAAGNLAACGGAGRAAAAAGASLAPRSLVALRRAVAALVGAGGGVVAALALAKALVGGAVGILLRVACVYPY